MPRILSSGVWVPVTAGVGGIYILFGDDDIYFVNQLTPGGGVSIDYPTFMGSYGSYYPLIIRVSRVSGINLPNVVADDGANSLMKLGHPSDAAGSSWTFPVTFSDDSWILGAGFDNGNRSQGWIAWIIEDIEYAALATAQQARYPGGGSIYNTSGLFAGNDFYQNFPLSCRYTTDGGASWNTIDLDDIAQIYPTYIWDSHVTVVSGYDTFFDDTNADYGLTTHTPSDFAGYDNGWGAICGWDYLHYPYWESPHPWNLWYPANHIGGVVGGYSTWDFVVIDAGPSSSHEVTGVILCTSLSTVGTVLTPFADPIEVTPRHDGSCYIVVPVTYSGPTCTPHVGDVGPNPLPVTPIPIRNGLFYNPTFDNYTDLRVYKVGLSNAYTVQVFTGLPTNFGFYGSDSSGYYNYVAVDPTDPDNIFILDYDLDLWTFVWGGSYSEQATPPWVSDGFWSVYNIGFSMQGTLFVPAYDGSETRLYRSPHGASGSWTYITLSGLYTLTPDPAVTTDSTGNVVAIVNVNDGTVLFSTDDGITWDVSGVILPTSKYLGDYDSI